VKSEVVNKQMVKHCTALLLINSVNHMLVPAINLLERYVCSDTKNSKEMYLESLCILK